MSMDNGAKKAAQAQQKLAMEQKADANRERAQEQVKATDLFQTARRSRMGFASLLTNGYTGFLQ